MDSTFPSHDAWCSLLSVLGTHKSCGICVPLRYTDLDSFLPYRLFCNGCAKNVIAKEIRVVLNYNTTHIYNSEPKTGIINYSKTRKCLTTLCQTLVKQADVTRPAKTKIDHECKHYLCSQVATSTKVGNVSLA